jgi:glutamine cyclotransferase
MKKLHIAAILTATIILATSLIVYVWLDQTPANTTRQGYTYSIVNAYPHDKDAYTQGLVYDNGNLYESTGLNGRSSLRRVELETGTVLQIHTLENQYFGEGITIFNNKIIQLTWRSHKAFIYDKETFNLLGEFTYPTEGWGITHDGNSLIMSDGTATLYFLNPDTYQETSTIEVHDRNGPVARLNELEYINDAIYANIYTQENIAIINPQNGQIKAYIDLTDITKTENLDANGVLNGIAYDPNLERIFITGKLWSQLYQITLTPQE